MQNKPQTSNMATKKHNRHISLGFENLQMPHEQFMSDEFNFDSIRFPNINYQQSVSNNQNHYKTHDSESLSDYKTAYQHNRNRSNFSPNTYIK